MAFDVAGGKKWEKVAQFINHLDHLWRLIGLRHTLGKFGAKCS